MKETLNEKQLLEWEQIRKKGRFSYALEKAILFTPIFFVFYLSIYYFWGTEKFGFGVVFDKFFKSFAFGLGIFFFKMLRFENYRKKSNLTSK